MSSRLEQIPYIYTLLLVTVYVALVTALSRITFTDAVCFVTFQVFAVYICGSVIVRICGIKLDSVIQVIGLSYATGYILQIVNYFLLVPFGMQKGLVILVAFEAIIALVYIYKCRKTYKKHGITKESLLIFGFILFIFFVYKFVLSFGRLYLSNDVMINPFGQPKDFYYHCQNTVAAKIGFPLMDMRDLGEVYYYHYFSSLFDAVESFVTGIPVVNLEAHLDQVQGVILMGFGAFSLIESAYRNASMKLWTCLAIFFSISNDAATGVSFPGLIYVNPFGCDCGIGLSFFLMFLVLEQLNHKFEIGRLILTCLFTAVATGTKGPCALVTIFAFGVVLIIEFFKKNYKVSLLYGMGVLLSFAVVYILLVAERSTGVEATNVVSGWIDFSMSSLKPFYVWTYHEKLISFGIPGFVSTLFCVVLWMFEAKPTVFLAILVSVILSIALRLRMNKYTISGVSAYLFANALGLLISQDGSSQMYFVLMGIMIAGIACGDVFDRSILRIKEFSVVTKMKLYIYVVLCFILIVGFKYYNVTAQTYIIKENIKSFVSDDNQEPAITEQSSVRMAEIDAYEWIRNNTDENDMLISDIYLMDNKEGDFITSSISERRLWQDGWTYSRLPDQVVRIKDKLQVLGECYDGNMDAINKVKGDGVKYLIHMKARGENRKLDKIGICVYENDSAMIYQL